MADHRRSLFLLSLCIFLLVFGETIQPAPRTQIYEQIICDARLPPSDDPQRCKATEVQDELAFLKGTERLLGAFPTLLAIPYGLLADRWGREFVLTLALTGLLLEESWNFLICWFSNIFNIRLVFAAVVFETIGGGFGVVTTMAHVIVADTTTGPARTTLFYVIHAIGILAAITGQLTSSSVMSFSLWLPWGMGLGLIGLALMASLVVREAPTPDIAEASSGETTALLQAAESLPGTEPHTTTIPGAAAGTDAAGNDEAEQKAGFIGHWERFIAGCRLVSTNWRLTMLLCLVLSCQISEDSVPMMLLLYVSKRFEWSFARANLLWAVGETVQLVVLLALLPAAGRLLQRAHLGGYMRDAALARLSAAFLGFGTLLLGAGVDVPMLLAGIIITSSAAGLQSLLRALITHSIDAKHISIVYSVITILHVIGGAMAGPLYSTMFSVGMRLGAGWTGLPFIVAGAVGLVSCLLLFGVNIRSKRSHETDS